jgi:hypothetical protein
MSTRRTTRRPVALAASLAMAVGGLAAATVARPVEASAAVTVTSHFIWTTTSSNVSAFFSFINNGATNAAPNALLFVTPTYDPGGICGCAVDTSPVGVIWAPGAQQWAIMQEDLSSMPVGVSFNVLVVQRSTAQVFTVTATSLNTTANGMTISSSAINGKSAALLQVTQSLPNGLGSVPNGHPIGVVYGLGSGGNLWDIQNVDNATMPLGAKFNVLVGAKPSNGGKALLLTGTSTNTFGSSTFINNAETNGNPNTVIFETQNADPGLHFGSGDVAPTGVIYDTSPSDVAAVFNESGSAMPTGTHYFNLLIFPS